MIRYFLLSILFLNQNFNKLKDNDSINVLKENIDPYFAQINLPIIDKNDNSIEKLQLMQKEVYHPHNDFFYNTQYIYFNTFSTRTISQIMQHLDYIFENSNGNSFTVLKNIIMFMIQLYYPLKAKEYEDFFYAIGSAHYIDGQSLKHILSNALLLLSQQELFQQAANIFNDGDSNAQSNLLKINVYSLPVEKLPTKVKTILWAIYLSICYMKKFDVKFNEINVHTVHPEFFLLLSIPEKIVTIKHSYDFINMKNTIATLFDVKTVVGKKKLYCESMGLLSGSNIYHDYAIRKKALITILQEDEQAQNNIRKTFEEVLQLENQLNNITNSAEVKKLLERFSENSLFGSFPKDKKNLSFVGSVMNKGEKFLYYAWNLLVQWQDILMLWQFTDKFYNRNSAIKDEEYEFFLKALHNKNLDIILDFTNTPKPVAGILDNPFFNTLVPFSSLIPRYSFQFLKSIVRGSKHFNPITMKDFFYNSLYVNNSENNNEDRLFAFVDTPKFFAGSFAVTLFSEAGKIYSLYQMYSKIKEIIHIWPKMYNYFDLLKKFFKKVDVLQKQVTALYKKNNLDFSLMMPELIKVKDMFENEKFKKSNIINEINNWYGASNLSFMVKTAWKVIFPAEIALFYREKIAKSNDLKSIYDFLGLIDITFAKIDCLKNIAQTTMPKIFNLEEYDNIFLDIKNMWVFLPNNLGRSIPNSLHLGTNERFNFKNACIVSPVAAGKTLLLASIMTNIFLSYIGVVCADEYAASDFSMILDFLSIEYVLGSGISKHLAETQSIQAITSILKKVPGKKIVFIDELHSGTYKTLVYEAQLDLPNILKDKDTIVFLTTHVPEVASFIQKKELSTGLFYLEVLYKGDFDFIPTYRLNHHNPQHNWWLDPKKQKIQESYVHYLRNKTNIDSHLTAAA